MCGKMSTTARQEFCIKSSAKMAWNGLDKLKDTGTPENKFACSWTPQNLKAIPLTCFFAPGISCNRPNMAELANKPKKLRFES